VWLHNNRISFSPAQFAAVRASSVRLAALVKLSGRKFSEDSFMPDLNDVETAAISLINSQASQIAALNADVTALQAQVNSAAPSPAEAQSAALAQALGVDSNSYSVTQELAGLVGLTLDGTASSIQAQSAAEPPAVSAAEPPPAAT
jgi:hypothetical protein